MSDLLHLLPYVLLYLASFFVGGVATVHLILAIEDAVERRKHRKLARRLGR